MKLYTPLIYRALNIAYTAHHGQTDKGGIPYIYHPAFLASQMDTEDEIIVALLHDVVEDTPVTFADLEQEGFLPTVLDALRLLTHDDSEPYLDYVRRVKSNPLAAKIKLADLRHNSNPSRNANLTMEQIARYEAKYAEAIKILEN
jgi:hypothetical protein